MRADLEAAKIAREKRARDNGDDVRRALCNPCYLKFAMTGDRLSLCVTCRPKVQ